MSDLPLVSIAAINYNNANFVIETLESIRSQTYPNIELIVIDDCSTDNSPAMIDEWLKGYKGVYKFIRHEVNKGVCEACTSGVNNATGKYYSAIATDDLMLPEKTALHVSILEVSDAKTGAVYSDAYMVNEKSEQFDGSFIPRHRQFDKTPSGNIYHALLQGNYIPGMSFLFKRAVFDVVGSFDKSLVYEDYDMWLRIASKFEIIYSDVISVKYRVRPGSLVSTIKNWGYSDMKIFLKHVGAPLPMQRLRDTAIHAYLISDGPTMPLVNELADKLNDRFFKTIFLLWHFNIPHQMGTIVLAKADPTLYVTKASDIKVDDRSGTASLSDRLLSALSFDEIKELARNAYASENTATKPLIDRLVVQTKNRFFKAVHLLWKYKVSVPNGLIILERIDSYCSTNRNKYYIDLCIYKDIFGAIKTGNSSFFKS